MWQARTDTLLRARRHLSDLLLDQLPVLRALRCALDAMSVGGADDGNGNAALLLEQVQAAGALQQPRRRVP